MTYTEQEERALICRVGFVYKDDYSVSFRDTQKLQRLRKKLLQCQSILAASRDVAARYKIHMQQWGTNIGTCKEFYLGQLDAYEVQMANHTRTIERFLQCSSGYLTTVSQGVSLLQEC